MIDLTNLTIIIPIKIESEDRLSNIKILLGYLNTHFITNIKIIETYVDYPKIDFIDLYNNLIIDYKNEQISNNEPYHRTKYLNMMLFDTKTEIISTYDSDVLLPIDTYINVVNELVSSKFDFIYPYGNGLYQKQLFYSGWYKNNNKCNMYHFSKKFDLSVFDDDPNVFLQNSYCGHSIFAKTKSYIDAFGENENFISYGPEDQERLYRFKKLGYNVKWYDDFVYHIEHIRTNDSWTTNPFFIKNCELFEKIKLMSSEDLIKIYSDYEYIQKYKNKI